MYRRMGKITRKKYVKDINENNREIFIDIEISEKDWQLVIIKLIIFSTLIIIKWKRNHIKNIRLICFLVGHFLLWGKF